jgi:hypothetical protein
LELPYLDTIGLKARQNVAGFFFEKKFSLTCSQPNLANSSFV